MLHDGHHPHLNLPCDEAGSSTLCHGRQQQLGQLGDKGILLLCQAGGRLRAIVSQLTGQGLVVAAAGSHSLAKWLSEPTCVILNGEWMESRDDDDGGGGSGPVSDAREA